MYLDDLIKLVPLNMPIKIGIYQHGEVFEGNVYDFIIDNSLRKFCGDEYEIFMIDIDYIPNKDKLGLSIILRN